MSTDNVNTNAPITHHEKIVKAFSRAVSLLPAEHELKPLMSFFAESFNTSFSEMKTYWFSEEDI